MLACAEPPAAGDAADDDAASADTTSSDSSGGEPLGPICDPSLAERVELEAIAAHLDALDEIAGAHAGTRAAGTPGYEASAAYVEAQLAASGYETSRFWFEFDRYVELSPALLEVLADEPGPLTEDLDYGLASYSPAGQVSAALAPVDLDLGPGNASTSGCEAEDFAGFTPGSIALIQWGACTFTHKASLAEEAGAVAVLIFNQGNSEDRLELFSGSLGSDNQLTIPVLLSRYGLGEQLAAQHAALAGLEALELSLTVDAETVVTETFDVLAESPGGDPSRVIMLGAHLDSVPAGPGVNDNGSGSAMILDLARALAACEPRHKVRFAWWGAEEWGLHGSRAWVETRDAQQLAALAFYLNFDMVASPNYVRYVHSGTPALFESFADYFESRAMDIEPLGFNGRSDYQPFVDAGVPAGGLATGAGGIKSSQQAETFGGQAGQAYDGCYHLACDDRDNPGMAVLEQNAKAAAHVLESWASELGQFAALPEVVALDPETQWRDRDHPHCGEKRQ